MLFDSLSIFVFSRTQTTTTMYNDYIYFISQFAILSMFNYGLLWCNYLDYIWTLFAVALWTNKRRKHFLLEISRLTTIVFLCINICVIFYVVWNYFCKFMNIVYFKFFWFHMPRSCNNLSFIRTTTKFYVFLDIL